MRRPFIGLSASLLFAACNCDTPPPAGRDASVVAMPPDAEVEIVTPDASVVVVCVDGDSDGHGQGCILGPDCNDADALVNPGVDEACGNGVDDDCDGQTDEAGCEDCKYGGSRECFTGAAASAGVGECRKGVQRCNADVWGPCEGQQLPAAEVCDRLDNDCDGKTDDGVLNACGSCGALPAESCDGVDNDCNGQTDEGCGTCDPGCKCGDAGACTCHPPANQPCYAGLPETAGVGECRSGLHDCVAQGGGVYKWNTCRNQVLPVPEVCGNGKDEDCDGEADDGCTPGCTPATEVCDGSDNDCDGLVDEGVTNACGGCGAPGGETCGDGLDNNCNGNVDEGCSCTGGSQACYRGPVGTQGKGVCKAGTQNCSGGELATWGPCLEDVLPQPETCGDGLDNDCDGLVDDGCACQEGQTRACGSSAGECVAGTQTCHQGAWGECQGGTGPNGETCDGKDNDCDGLVDDGVLNACGKCPPAPCYTEDYSTPSNCSAPGRTCDDVTTDPNNPNAVTLNQSTNTLFPYIYIAVTNLNQVALLNTETGAKIWQKSSYGMNPSRTAVALDGTVWVGNRCLTSGRDDDYTCSSMAHLDLNGNLICRADVPGWVRGVAIDADGNVWAGTWNGKSVWKVSGTEVNAAVSPPRCKILGSINLGTEVYGLAVDSKGRLWTASNPTKKIDVATVTVLESIAHSGYYGIAIDQQDRVWFSGIKETATVSHATCPSPNPANRGLVHRIDPEPPHGVLYVPGTCGVSGITVHPDGSIWGSRYYSPYGVVKITLDPTGSSVANVQNFADPTVAAGGCGSTGCHNHGIAVDRAGKLWSSQRFLGYANRWKTTGQHDGRFAVSAGNDIYTYSDMTGIQLRTITSKEGHWIQDFDSGYLTPTWDRAEWTETQPTGTLVEVRFRAADNQADFAAGKATAWCGPYSVSPVDFASKPACAAMNGHRWIQAEVHLSTTVDGVRPTFSGLKIYWSY